MNLLLSSKINPNKYLSTSPVYLRDTKTKGFAIKVNPSGSHKYIVEFFRRGKSKRVTLGSTSSLCLQEARDSALKVLSDYDVYLTSKPARLTLASLIEEYLDARNLSAASCSDYDLTFNYFPSQDIRIDRVDSSQIQKWYLDNEHIPTTIDKIYRQLKAVFNYAVQRQYIQTNPFNLPKGIRYKPEAKTNYLEPENQLPRFWKALNSTESVTRDIIKFYLLTGMRRSEIYKSELKDGLIKLPNTKNGSDHYIPVIQSMPLHLFELDRDKWTKDCRKTIARVCKEAEVPIVTVHDLRRTVASLCAYLGIDLGSIKHLLNHSVKGDVTLAHYIQYRADHLLPVMQKIDLYYKSIS